MKPKGNDAKQLRTDEWRELLRSEQAPLLRVNSDSMEPTLHVGEQIQVRGAEVFPAAGAVLVYQRGPELVVHRYLGNGRCRGDNRLATDPAINKADLVGIAVAVCRNGVMVPISGPGWCVRLRRARRLVGYYLRRIFAPRTIAGARR